MIDVVNEAIRSDDGKSYHSGYTDTKIIAALGGDNIDYAFVTTAFKMPEPAADKAPSVKVLEDDELLKAYAMKVVRILPTTGADFAAERMYLYRQADPESMAFLQDYLKIENVAQRLKYKSVVPLVKRTAAP